MFQPFPISEPFPYSVVGRSLGISGTGMLLRLKDLAMSKRVCGRLGVLGLGRKEMGVGRSVGRSGRGLK